MNFILDYELEVIPSYNGFVDCVYRINVTNKCIDGEDEIKDFSIITLQLPDTASDGYIPFDQLTDQKVREWIARVYPVEAVQKYLSEKMFVIKNPVVIKPLVNMG